MILAFDLLAIVTALAAALLWFQASQRRLRRIARAERLDAADLNRIIVAINRAQILNGRAALATGLSASAVALRFALDVALR